MIYRPSSSDLKKDRTAFCYDIILNFTLSITQGTGLHLFLLKFKGITDVSSIEQLEDISLYQVTERNFVYVRVKAGVDLQDIEAHPLTFLSQHSNAEEVITVPRETIERYLEEKPERDGSNISLLYSAGRCGSTLVASMVHKTQQRIVLSEPYALKDVAQIFNTRNIAPEEKNKLVKTTLLLLCKDADKLYFIKVPTIIAGSIIHVVHSALPGIRELYMYRALVPTLSSFKKILGRVHYWHLANVIPLLQPRKYRKILEKFEKTPGSDEKFLFTIFCIMHPFYLESQTRKEIKSYSYESLLRDKRGFCKSFLAEIGINEEYIELALSALKKDAQENSPISKKNVAGNFASVSKETYQWGKKVAREEFGIVLEGDDCHVANMPNSWEEDSKW